MNSIMLALLAALVAGSVAGVLTFTVATGTVGVLNLQSQAVVACNGLRCWRTAGAGVAACPALVGGLAGSFFAERAGEGRARNPHQGRCSARSTHLAGSRLGAVATSRSPSGADRTCVGLRRHLPSQSIPVLLVDRLHAQQAFQKVSRPACVHAHRLQPRDAQALVVDVAAALSDVLFDLGEVPPKSVGVHAPLYAVGAAIATG
jgi:hypothetical protein